MRPEAAGTDRGAELGDYVGVLRRRWRILIAVPAIIVALAAVYSSRLTPVYTADAEVLLQPFPSLQGTPQPISVETEARLLTSSTIGGEAQKFMGPEWETPRLLDRVSVSTTPETQILDISFWAADPQTASHGANAFAGAYKEYKTGQIDDILTEQRDSISDLIEQRVEERNALNRFLQTSTPDSAPYLNAQAELESLNGQIALLNAQLAQVPAPGVVPVPEVILPATPPDSPSSPNHMVNILLGVFFGVFLGVAAAFVVDRLDDTVRSREALDWIEAPLLAEIPRSRIWRHRPHRGRPIVDSAPRSAVAESYRTLRAGVVALARRREAKVVAIVAATAGEGKTATTANLAAALAQADNRVLAISADLRRPSLHEQFGVPNDRGLADVLAGATSVSEAMQQVGPNLTIISGGPIPDRPSELLQSAAMAELVRSTSLGFDFVLIDTPPVLGLADTLALAPLADIRLLVAQAGRSDRTALWQMAEMLAQVDAGIDAIVLVGAASGPAKYGYGYGHEERDQGVRRRWSGGLAKVERPRRPTSGDGVPTDANGDGVAVEDDGSVTGPDGVRRPDGARSSP